MSIPALSSSDESGFGTKALEDPGIQEAQICADSSGSPGRRPRLRQVASLPEDDIDWGSSDTYANTSPQTRERVTYGFHGRGAGFCH